MDMIYTLETPQGVLFTTRTTVVGALLPALGLCDEQLRHATVSDYSGCWLLPVLGLGIKARRLRSACLLHRRTYGDGRSIFRPPAHVGRPPYRLHRHELCR